MSNCSFNIISSRLRKAIIRLLHKRRVWLSLLTSELLYCVQVNLIYRPVFTADIAVITLTLATFQQLFQCNEAIRVRV